MKRASKARPTPLPCAICGSPDPAHGKTKQHALALANEPGEPFVFTIDVSEAKTAGDKGRILAFARIELKQYFGHSGMRFEIQPVEYDLMTNTLAVRTYIAYQI